MAGTLTLNLSYRNPGTDALESNPISPPITGDWQFAKAQQYGAKRPLYPIYPRPTAEVNTFATHLWAHSTMTYELKPCVSFGCWPHKWELITAPAGMTIGGELTRTTVDGLISHTVGSSYQKIVWSGAKSGTHTVVARCTDQLGNYVDLTWAITVDDSKYAVVDSSAPDDTGAGTLASPKKLFSSVWTVGNVGKAVVFRGGSYTCTETGDLVNVGFNNSNRPSAIIAYPGETVTATGSLWRSGGIAGAANDLVVRGIEFINYGIPGDNTQVFKFDGVQKRVHFEDVSFDDVISGAPEIGDNQSCISFREAGAAHEDISLIDCSVGAGVEVCLFIIFHIERCLLERGRSAIGMDIPNSNGGGFFNIKDQSNDICVRGMFFSGAIDGDGTPASISNQNSPGNNIEHCWSTYCLAAGTPIMWNAQRFTAGGSNQFDYANSSYAGGGYCAGFAFYSPSTLKVINEGFAGLGWGLYFLGGGTDWLGYQAGTVPNQFLASGQMSATTGLLQGASLEANRLSIGAETWSEA